MSEEYPSILSHVSLGTNDIKRAARFYDETLASIGIKRVVTIDGIAMAYGRLYPEFWIALPHNDEKATVGNGVHIGFIAKSKLEVHAFYDAALAVGGLDEGAPGPRPIYGEPYYGCFILDPDGHKIEASFWDTSLA